MPEARESSTAALQRLSCRATMMLAVDDYLRERRA